MPCPSTAPGRSRSTESGGVIEESGGLVESGAGLFISLAPFGSVVVGGFRARATVAMDGGVGQIGHKARLAGQGLREGCPERNGHLVHVTAPTAYEVDVGGM